MRKNEIVVLGIVVLSFVIGISFYSQMPEQMASHWNAQGQVNGYLSKFWGTFLLPLNLLICALLLILIPKIDPLKINVEKFRKHYDGFIIVFSLFLLFVHFFQILWNLGFKINPIIILLLGLGGLGVLFFYIGVLCENAKRNWFIGIRTPWTLSSDSVWEKTHKIGGKLFKITGVIVFIGIFFQRYAWLFVLIPVIFTVVYTVIYSYLEYKKETK